MDISMKYETLPKKVLLLWECAAVVCLGVLVLLVLIIFTPKTIVWYIILWLLGALGVLTMFLYFPLLYISTRYVVLTDQIVLKQGVVFNKTHYLRRETISFISVYKNPFTELMNLSTLIISSPGARIFIPLMSHRRAVSIAKELSYKNRFKEK